MQSHYVRVPLSCTQLQCDHNSQKQRALQHQLIPDLGCIVRFSVPAGDAIEHKLVLISLPRIPCLLP